MVALAGEVTMGANDLKLVPDNINVPAVNFPSSV
jgi:hypothetical protein